MACDDVNAARDASDERVVLMKVRFCKRRGSPRGDIDSEDEGDIVSEKASNVPDRTGKVGETDIHQHAS